MIHRVNGVEVLRYQRPQLDPDGRVDHFQWRISNNGTDGISVQGGENVGVRNCVTTNSAGNGLHPGEIQRLVVIAARTTPLQRLPAA